ncbi:MAG: GNAT family N-acetyltransferase [Alphaproteobacteria bacterium]|nr:GNAT family N-acetyltransferase [Alphaproteobacteria bacterium]
MIDIRPATSRDSHTLALIGIRSWESAVIGWGENTEAVQTNARNAYHEFCSKHWTRIVLAQDGGAVLGWAAREKLDNNITDLWIDPEHQRKGAGKKLLAALEKDIAKAGYDSVILETHAKNEPAIGFYEHFGYRVVSLSVGYSAGLGQDIQIVKMHRDLGDPPVHERMTT